MMASASNSSPTTNWNKKENGAAGENRTPDLVITNDALYHWATAAWWPLAGFEEDPTNALFIFTSPYQLIDQTHQFEAPRN